MLLLQDSALVRHFKDRNEPLPFSLSAVRKDRFSGQLGGLPYRRIGGQCLYNPDEITDWLAGQPIIQPTTGTARAAVPRAVRQGRPTKIEQIEARRLGLSVRELRAQRALEQERGAQ